MRIAVNTRFLIPGQLEGFGWYTHEIRRRMVIQHPEDQFIFFFDRAYDPRFVYAPNVKPIVLYPPARLPVLFRIWFEWAVPRALIKQHADVFFSPDSMCSLRSKVPAVMTCHDLVPLHFPNQIEKRHRTYLLENLPKWLRRANRVITVSEFVKTDIAQTCQIPIDKIDAVYNACREGFSPLSSSEIEAVRQQYADGQSYFFYAGAIHPRKNVPRMIEAFDIFKQETKAPVKLLLAGRFAWQTGEVKTAWEQAACKQDIRFLGYVDEDALPKLTAASLASVYISISEGFGLPLVEAMACQVPVMTSNTSCLPEVAGDAALLVDPYSLEAIADGMNSLYSNAQLRNELIEKGKTQLEKYDWDKAAEKVYQILKDTASGA